MCHRIGQRSCIPTGLSCGDMFSVLSLMWSLLVPAGVGEGLLECLTMCSSVAPILPTCPALRSWVL